VFRPLPVGAVHTGARAAVIGGRVITGITVGAGGISRNSSSMKKPRSECLRAGLLKAQASLGTPIPIER
jgi:hypothetical protein